jgi:hypothetical protein
VPRPERRRRRRARRAAPRRGARGRWTGPTAVWRGASGGPRPSPATRRRRPPRVRPCGGRAGYAALPPATRGVPTRRPGPSPATIRRRASTSPRPGSPRRRARERCASSARIRSRPMGDRASAPWQPQGPRAGRRRADRGRRPSPRGDRVPRPSRGYRSHARPSCQASVAGFQPTPGPRRHGEQPPAMPCTIGGVWWPPRVHGASSIACVTAMSARDGSRTADGQRAALGSIGPCAPRPIRPIAIPTRPRSRRRSPAWTTTCASRGTRPWARPASAWMC